MEHRYINSIRHKLNSKIRLNLDQQQRDQQQQIVDDGPDRRQEYGE